MLKIFKISFIVIGLSLIYTNMIFAKDLTPKVNLNGTVEVYSEDIADFNTKTGVGCIITKDKINKNKAHILCKSKYSAENAWNAVTVRSKKLCSSKKWKMLFLRSPSLPKNGIFGSQMDIECVN